MFFFATHPPLLSESEQTARNHSVGSVSRVVPRGGEQTRRLSAMVNQYADAIWQALRRMGVRDQTEDALQQVFIIASDKIDSIREGSEKAFLLGTSARVAANFRRKVARRKEDNNESVGDVVLDESPSPEELVAQKRMKEVLEQLLNKLPDDLRIAFVLYELEGLSCPEIAEHLGIPVGTASSRLRRAREMFQTEVEKIQSKLKNGGAQ